ncbi:MAG: hypothetical protein IKW68_05320 [Clostridia bacterium]|nr:hypothetical protein [Clostridia bacterium]
MKKIFRGHEKNTTVPAKARYMAEDAGAEKPAIGEAEVLRAAEILRRYRDGKASLERKLVENEEYWRLRQWNVRGEGKPSNTATAWLWSCIQSRYSDAMDSYPTCNLRPRSEDDVAEAKRLSDIIPVILEQNDFEGTYSDVTWYTLKHGGGVYGVFWDPEKNGGLGDVSCVKVDLLNLFWEPGITDLQKSANVFRTELVDNDVLLSKYPHLEGQLGGKSISITRYLYDDYVDTSDKSVVVEWYYHTSYGGRRQLQYCVFVGGHVLYASENDTAVPTRAVTDPMTGETVLIPDGISMRERGWYDHGLYPFVVQPLYPIEGSICGYGLTDIGRDTQDEIDSLNRAITKNAIVSATPRWFKRKNGTVNTEQYADLSCDFVDVEGQIDDASIRRIDQDPLGGVYVNILQSKIDELKYCTSNRDVLNGASPGGITAASALAALQETAGKNARSSNRVFHRAFREVIYHMVELIRQFYDAPRCFRISGGSAGGADSFVPYTNDGLKPHPIFNSDGTVAGHVSPEFDIEVTSEKASPYKKMEINELALQFYNLGFFNPTMGDQAVSCLKMMDFDGKEQVIDLVTENAAVFKQLTQYQTVALTLAEKYEPETAEMLSREILVKASPSVKKRKGKSTSKGEHPMVKRSRANARGATQPR